MDFYQEISLNSLTDFYNDSLYALKEFDENFQKSFQNGNFKAELNDQDFR